MRIKKRFIMLPAVLMMGLSVNAAAETYMDVNAGDWYYSAVNYVSDNQIMTGMNSTYFGVGEELARAQFTVILYRMEGEPKVTYDARFADVKEGEWYTDAVLWANNAGIVTGYSATGNFGPSDGITREQMATMLYRYAQYRGSTGEVKETDLAVFPDVSAVHGYAYEAMQWAVEHKLINGDGGYLRPQSDTGREVCATIIARFLNEDSDEFQPDKPNWGPQSIDGKAVVAYARQFLGNPYVYGGTSLTDGADCSGFVQSVYKNFGITLGRTTWDQEKDGFEIPITEVQPGDLILYEGHVGIYSGNGNIIHASDPSRGIIESNCFYDIIKTVRRVL